jgi:hypothetical protein
LIDRTDDLVKRALKNTCQVPNRNH